MDRVIITIALVTMVLLAVALLYVLVANFGLFIVAIGVGISYWAWNKAEEILSEEEIE